MGTNIDIKMKKIINFKFSDSRKSEDVRKYFNKELSLIFKKDSSLKDWLSINQYYPKYSSSNNNEDSIVDYYNKPIDGIYPIKIDILIEEIDNISKSGYDYIIINYNCDRKSAVSDGKYSILNNPSCYYELQGFKIDENYNLDSKKEAERDNILEELLEESGSIDIDFIEFYIKKKYSQKLEDYFEVTKSVTSKWRNIHFPEKRLYEFTFREKSSDIIELFSKIYNNIKGR